MNSSRHRLSHRNFQVAKSIMEEMSVKYFFQPYNNTSSKSEFQMYPRRWQHFSVQRLDLRTTSTYVNTFGLVPVYKDHTHAKVINSLPFFLIICNSCSKTVTEIAM